MRLEHENVEAILVCYYICITNNYTAYTKYEFKLFLRSTSV